MPVSPLEVAVGHRAADGDRGVVDAGLFVVLAVEQLDVVAVLLGPCMYIRSSISAQSLASVPPSRALIVRIAPAASCGPLSRALSLSSSSERFEPLDLAGHFGGERLVLARPFRSSRRGRRCDLIASSSGLTIELSDLRSSTAAWAFSWLSQKSGCRHFGVDRGDPRSCLAAQSKRVSELEDRLADRFGAVDEFFFHASWSGTFGVRPLLRMIEYDR